MTARISKKLPVPTKRATVILIEVKPCYALLRMLLVGIKDYLKLVLRYKFLVLDIHYPDTLYSHEQGCENPWFFSGTKRGPRAKKLGKHCCVGNCCELRCNALIAAHF